MTLTQVATLTRHTILIISITLMVGIASFIGYRVWYAYYQSTLPPVEEKPDTKFGVLPFPDFPKASVSSSNFSYSLDTQTGGLPKLGDVGFEKLIKVYFIIKSYATLLSPERSQALAEKFGIGSSPEILSEINYRYKDKNITLTADLDSGNFIYVKEYANEASISAKETLDDTDKLKVDFKNILSKLGVLKEELKQGRVKVTLLKKVGGEFVPTELGAEAEATQISLWPQDMDKKPISTSDVNQALVNAQVIKSAENLENYLSLKFTYWPIDTTTFATYPIKDPEQAFADLKSGQGVVVLEPIQPQVSITSVYLSYFLSEQYSPYLQPIFVFEGPHFMAYVPAIIEQFQNPAK